MGDNFMDRMYGQNGSQNVILDRGYVFCKKNNIPEKSRVLRKLGIRRNSYMWSVVGRFYDYFFKDLINFNVEYEKYYKKEFQNCARFIVERYNLTDEEAERYSKDDYWFKDLRESVERNISNLNLYEEFAEPFWKVIGGYTCESSNGLYY